MKKLGLLCVFLLLSQGAFAQGNYSGIWRATIDSASFVSVNQNGSALVIAALASNGEWDAYLGMINGTTAVVATVIGRANVTMTVRFVSGSQAVARLDSCQPFPGYVCLHPIGTEITYNKIF
jgi:hypothetical protein